MNLSLFNDSPLEEGTRAVLATADSRCRGEWSDYVVHSIRLFSRSRDKFTTEQFREWFAGLGGEEPHHPNAWGAVFRKAALAGVIEPTCDFVKSRHAAAHSRVVGVWRRVE